jgi:hypothetical protein
MSQVSSAKVLITPAYAQRSLDDTAKIIRNDPKTKEHRNICQQTAHLYTRDMLNGDWALNGEVISLDHAGALNGKQRLLACLAGGVNFTTDRAPFDRFAIHRGVQSTPPPDGVQKLIFLNQPMRITKQEEQDSKRLRLDR